MTIFQIEDGRPFITHKGLPVQWHTGSAPWWRMTSSVVRINKRGVAFKPPLWRTRDLPSLPGWVHEACLPSASGLCSTQSSEVFPSQSTPVVNEALDWLCGSTATYRSVSNVSRYDVSACDVLDAKQDFVLANDVLSRADTNLPEWVYWTVCVVIVYLVRCLSKYVLESLRKDNAQLSPTLAPPPPPPPSSALPNPILCVSACAFASLLVLYQGDFVYVTEEELLFHWCTLFYVASYTLLFVGTRLLSLFHWKLTRSDPPFYNLLAGVMLLVSSRLYCGSETPYTPPLIFIIAVRVAVKSRRGSDATRSLTILLDAFMLSLVCIMGFSPDTRYLIALFAAAGAASDMLVD
jgi:hypothetical protein